MRTITLFATISVLLTGCCTEQLPERVSTDPAWRVIGVIARPERLITGPWVLAGRGSNGLLFTLPAPPDDVVLSASARDDGLIAILTEQQGLILFDLSSKQETGRASFPGARGLSWDPSNTKLAVAFSDQITVVSESLDPIMAIQLPVSLGASNRVVVSWDASAEQLAVSTEPETYVAQVVDASGALITSAALSNLVFVGPGELMGNPRTPGLGTFSVQRFHEGASLTQGCIIERSYRVHAARADVSLVAISANVAPVGAPSFDLLLIQGSDNEVIERSIVSDGEQVVIVPAGLISYD